MASQESLNSTTVAVWSSSSETDTFEKVRPNYNIDAVEFLLEKFGALATHSDSEPFTLVELGAGTGKFTRAVLEVIDKRSINNVKVVPTEPMKEMCETFKESVPNVEIYQRPAHDLGLASNSVDAVVAAQCFHWFANTGSVHEIHRVLKPGGYLGVIFNVPDPSLPYIHDLEALTTPKYWEVDAYWNDKRVYRPVSNHGRFGELNTEASHRYSMETDFEGIIQRYKTYSVIAQAEKSEKDALMAKVEHIMKTHPDVKDKEKFNYDFVVELNWFKKLHPEE